MWSFKSQVRFNVIVFILFAFYGCSSLEFIDDIVKDNPVIASASFRFATRALINHSDTDSGRAERASRVLEIASNVKLLIDENTLTTVPGVIQYLNSTIGWGGIDEDGRVLIQELLTLSEAYLSVNEEVGHLINVKELLDTVISAASLYVDSYP